MSSHRAIDLDHTIRGLRSDGVALTEPLSSGEIADITAYLDKCEVYNAHVRAKATQSVLGPAMAANQRWPAFTTDMHDIVKAPHLFEAALEVMPVAAEYFQEPALLYSMNAFWTHPSQEIYLDTHGWHSDGDDRKQLVFFVFASDILTPEEGGHIYQVGTHMGHSNCREHRCIIGPAGTTFMSDTNGLHVGIRPNKQRLLLWARWGVSDPPQSYHWDQLSPVPRAEMGARYPQDPLLQHAVHLVVA